MLRLLETETKTTMTQERPKNPGFFKHLLVMAGMGVAILIGFVLGLRVGKEPHPHAPVLGLLEMPAVFDTVAAPDTVSSLVLAPLESISSFSKQQIARGVEYLATHNCWNRDEMEQIPTLKGLWDSVNTYALDDLRRYNDLLASAPLACIVEGLEQMPRQGCYAAKTDRVITLSTYMKRLRQTGISKTSG